MFKSADAATPCASTTESDNPGRISRPRKLLIYTRTDYTGHLDAVTSANEMLARMGAPSEAFDVTVSDQTAVFEAESLRTFDAVFLNNTIGRTCDDPRLRQNLIDFIVAGGGLMGVHGTVISFTHSIWPAQEDWPEFGSVLGARGYAHRHGLIDEPIVVALDDPDHPLNRPFNGKYFEWTDEFFRFSEPYSRQTSRVLLRIDVDRTDLSRYQPGDECLRPDHDYALAWIRQFGRGRVFYSVIGHSPRAFEDPRLAQFYFDAARFVLGDLDVPTTPSARLTPAVRAREKLKWRLGIEAYTFHKFTFFEMIAKIADLGLSYIGGLSFMQKVSTTVPKDFDQHLSDDELCQIRFELDRFGVRLLTYYAQHIPADEPGCRKLFNFARRMGIETIMCEPKPESLDMLDRFAQEYDISVAIHNHGKELTPDYWRPEDVLKACQGRSRYIGACPDTGYWLREGIDPIEGLRMLKDRVITVHLHDLNEGGGNGHDVPWGTGVGKPDDFLREMLRLGIRPTMIGIEYAHDWAASMPKIARCIDLVDRVSLELVEHEPPTTPHQKALP